MEKVEEKLMFRFFYRIWNRKKSQNDAVHLGANFDPSSLTLYFSYQWGFWKLSPQVFWLLALEDAIHNAIAYFETLANNTSVLGYF